MKKIILTLVAALAAITASAADYNSLKTRFAQADPTLTEAEVAEVYYQSPKQNPQFNPSPDFTRINSLRAEGRYSELLPLCQAELQSDPTALTPLFRAFAAAVNTGNDAVKQSTQWQVNAVCDAIFASGKGVGQESPWRVTRTDDITPFLLNYVRVDEIIDSSKLGPFTVVKVNMPGREEAAYLYFLVQ